jgi:hypothetical protein
MATTRSNETVQGSQTSYVHAVNHVSLMMLSTSIIIAAVFARCANTILATRTTQNLPKIPNCLERGFKDSAPMNHRYPEPPSVARMLQGSIPSIATSALSSKLMFLFPNNNIIQTLPLPAAPASLIDPSNQRRVRVMGQTVDRNGQRGACGRHGVKPAGKPGEHWGTPGFVVVTDEVS